MRFVLTIWKSIVRQVQTRRDDIENGTTKTAMQLGGNERKLINGDYPRQKQYCVL